MTTNLASDGTTVVPELSTLPDQTEIDGKKEEEVHHMEQAYHVDGQLPVSKYTHLTRMQTTRLFWKATLFCCMASWGAGVDGYQQNIPGNIIANPGFVAVFGERAAAGVRALDPQHLSAWGGCQVAGNIVGAMHAPFIADRFGRKFVLFYMILLLIIGVVCELVARDWRVWAVAKIFTGLSVGITQTQCVIYVSEIAPVQTRGMLLGTYPFGYGLGGFIASLALQILDRSKHQSDYKRAIHSQWAMSASFLIMLIFMPESPWWLAKKGRHEDGKKVLQKMNGYIKDYDVEHEYSVLQANIEESRKLAREQGSASWKEIFQGQHARRLLISAMPSVYCQLSGINLMFGYISYIFSLIDFAQPFLAGVIVNIILLLSLFVSYFTVDRFGRRPIYITTISLITLSLLMVGVLGTIDRTKAIGFVLIFFFCLWVACYSLGPSFMAAVYAGEISTPRLRAKTNSFAQGFAQMFALIITYCVPLMLDKWELKVGYFFAGVSFLGGAATLLIVPETKGRSYAELDELFTRKVPTLKFAKTKTTVQMEMEARDPEV